MKAILFSFGCLVAWFALLPALVIGGGIALLTYALCAELFAAISGSRDNTLDLSTAREIARRMCAGYAIRARAIRTQP